jgi:hypothetical protein
MYTGCKHGLHPDSKEKQRAYCKNRGFLGKYASEINTDLDLVYEEKAISYRSQVGVNV